MLRIIAGYARGRRFRAPEGRDTRPTLDRVRENLFNMLQGRCLDARTLDLFAGSGAMSLEALSRGAAFAVLADRDREAIRVEKENLAALGMTEKSRVIRSEWQDTVRTLTAEGEKFDLIFLDPPYQMTDLREMTELLLLLMAEEGLLILEHQARAEVRVTEELEIIRERTWGYCGVKIYERMRDSGIL